MKLLSKLPPYLIPFEEQIISSKTSYIKIRPQQDSKTDFWQSKIGGFPYCPINHPYPKDYTGKDLLFLAQINCAELPQNPYFPKKGILQFFINDDSLYGMGIPGNMSSSKYQVIYHQEVSSQIDDIWVDFSSVREYRKSPHITTKSFPISFSLEEEIVPIGDINIYKYVDEENFKLIKENDLDDLNKYIESNSSSGHKMGGYAFFAQEDPRKIGSTDFLLLQIDSDPKIECYWGDMGVGHFFIKIDDLINRDYSKAYFQWDDYSNVNPNPY